MYTPVALRCLPRICLVVLPAVLFFATPSFSQDLGVARTSEYAEERSVIEDLLQTVVAFVRDVTLGTTDDVATRRLFELSDRLAGATDAVAGTRPVAGQPLRADELEQARILLLDLVDQTADVRQELRVDGHAELAERMRNVENGLLDAVALIKKAQARRGEPTDEARRPADDGDRREAREQRDEWRDWAEDYKRRRAAERDDNDRRDTSREDDWYDADRDDEDWAERDRDDEDWEFRYRWRRAHRGFDPGGFVGTHVGEFGYGWPYRETGSYRSIPAIRYNRVDGFFLGVRRLPLSWDSWERGRLYGHGGYAFGAKDWQYEIGAEARLGSRRNRGNLDLKVGGSYRNTTATEDLWKSSWVENSLAAFFFNYDFLDYFNVEGFSVYSAARLSPLVQVTGAYRQEEYASLANEVTWSMFGGRDFRFNPPIMDGDMNSVLVAVEGGSVSDLDWLPRGAAFRLEAEFGRDFGGDFDFNRYLGDVRAYLPFTRRSTLSLRLRGGSSTGTLPLQKAFTLGGIGSMRSYAQNSFVGTRMVLGNVEYAFMQDWIWDDFLVAGFVDAGWVNNTGSDKFDFSDVYPSVGAGLGLIDRSVRLEISWPLRDVGGKREPSIWLRINPSF